MSVTHNISQQQSDKALDQSTFALTISSVSFQGSETNHEYDEEFTLNPVTVPNKSRKNCLAFQVAQTFPPRIKQEVTKMVEYYEDTLENQAKEYHRIVEENHKLKKQNNKLRAINLSNEFKFTEGGKENASPFKKTKAFTFQEEPAVTPLSPARSRLNSRVTQLQNLVLDKDRKINELNSQISDLMLKVRRYKRKLQENNHN